MRNSLTAALAAMAIHTVGALAFRWPYPSVATFAAGMLAAVGAVVGSGYPRGVACALTVALLAPAILPAPLLGAVLAPFLVHSVRVEDDPLQTIAIALPALLVLALAFAV